MRVGLICIATGESYHQYARNLHASAKKFFPSAEFILFTDIGPANPGVDKYFRVQPKGYPYETLYRYHTMMSKMNELLEYDQLFYCDADMEFVANVSSEIFSKGLTATLHPGYFKQNQRGTPELRMNSRARCENNTRYYCGGFQGGSATSYLNAAGLLAARISMDDQMRITAVWHDESHWNKLLADKPPETVLTPSYCFPEDYDGGYGWSREDYPPILVALDKRKRGNHPRFPNVNN